VREILQQHLSQQPYNRRHSFDPWETWRELTVPSARAKVAAIASLASRVYGTLEGNMTTGEGRPSQLALWRISLAGLCLLGTLVANSLSDWSAPVNLGPTVNAASAEL
ncbi:MAG: hypothetical protein ACRD88_05180, partial [Terriglobia bacterium]